MNQKGILTCLIVMSGLVLGSCLRLDDNLFNLKYDLTEYKLDDYEGEVEFRVEEAKYQLPDSLITLFQIESSYLGEKRNIHAVYIGDLSRIQMDTVIVYCHGNRDHMDFYWHRAKLLANLGDRGYGVLMFDYQGYGLSEGKPTEEGMYNDLESCLNWLKDRGLSSERLVVYGFSLGSAPSVELALSAASRNTLECKKLILEAPFASSQQMVYDAGYLAFPVSFYSDIRIDNAAKIKDYDGELMWIHGVEDNFLKIDTHGEQVFENCPSTKRAHRIEVADHGDVPLVWGFENYIDALNNFIRD